MTRGSRRRRLAAGRGRGRDRGSSAVELAILAPALILISLLIVEFAIWTDARHAALAAAQEGDLVAREDAFTNPGGWPGLAQNATTSYYRGLDTSVINGFSATTGTGPDDTVSVTVSGELNSVLPLPFHVQVTGPVECFRTEVSEGENCG